MLQPSSVGPSRALTSTGGIRGLDKYDYLGTFDRRIRLHEVAICRPRSTSAIVSGPISEQALSGIPTVSIVRAIPTEMWVTFFSDPATSGALSYPGPPGKRLLCVERKHGPTSLPSSSDPHLKSLIYPALISQKSTANGHPPAGSIALPGTDCCSRVVNVSGFFLGQPRSRLPHRHYLF